MLTSTMAIALVVVASLVALTGWVLSLAGISGTWLLLLATIGADLAVDGDVDWVASSIVFGVLCVAAEVAELVSGFLGAKSFGGGKWAQSGAFVGTIIGGVLGSALPVVGNIIGAILGGFVGAIVGELLYSGKHKGGKESLAKGAKAGVGAMIARAVSIAIKASLSTIMLVWFVWVVVDNLSSN